MLLIVAFWLALIGVVVALVGVRMVALAAPPPDIPAGRRAELVKARTAPISAALGRGRGGRGGHLGGGVAYGVLALGDIRSSDGRLTGRGMALTGVVLGILVLSLLAAVGGVGSLTASPGLSGRSDVPMPRWEDVEREVPELAAAARALPGGTDPPHARHDAPRRRPPHQRHRDAHRRRRAVVREHVPLAQGARPPPRPALRAAQRHRDDPPGWTGDATVSGTGGRGRPRAHRAIFGQAPPGPSHLFRADVTELTVVTLADSGDHLMLESWVDGRGYRRRTRT